MSTTFTLSCGCSDDFDSFYTCKKHKEQKVEAVTVSLKKEAQLKMYSHEEVQDLLKEQKKKIKKIEIKPPKNCLHPIVWLQGAIATRNNIVKIMTTNKHSPFVFHCSCGELATHLNVKVGEEVKDFCDECYIFTKSIEKNIK